jgi:hypothetical protein
LKFAIVPAYLLEATCAPVQAAGRAPRDLDTERNGWRLLEELIVIVIEIMAVVNSKQRLKALYTNS